MATSHEHLKRACGNCSLERAAPSESIIKFPLQACIAYIDVSLLDQHAHFRNFLVQPNAFIEILEARGNIAKPLQFTALESSGTAVADEPNPNLRGKRKARCYVFFSKFQKIRVAFYS
jgi:hypothetical protein